MTAYCNPLRTYNSQQERRKLRLKLGMLLTQALTLGLTVENSQRLRFFICFKYFPSFFLGLANEQVRNSPPPSQFDKHPECKHSSPHSGASLIQLDLKGNNLISPLGLRKIQSEVRSSCRQSSFHSSYSMAAAMTVLITQQYSLRVIQDFDSLLQATCSCKVQFNNSMQMLNFYSFNYTPQRPRRSRCADNSESCRSSCPTSTIKILRKGSAMFFPVRKHSSLWISLEQSTLTDFSSNPMQSQFSCLFLKTATIPKCGSVRFSMKLYLWVSHEALYLVLAEPIVQFELSATSNNTFPNPSHPTFSHFLLPAQCGLQLMSRVQLESEELDLSAYLLNLCKTAHGSEEAERERPQIDFILLERELARVQGIQQRTCEQIVQFVDQHRERFIEINQQLGHIEDKVKRSEAILKLLAAQVDQHKATCYLNESKVQRVVTEYEMHRVHEQLMATAMEQAQFLMSFNSQFEAITSRDVGALSLSHKYLLSRFTFKLQYLRALLSHHILVEEVPDTLQLQDILANIAQELEFYLSEQLAKYQTQLSAAREDSLRLKLAESLGLIRSWYINLGKKEDYYKIFEKNTIEREMQAGEKALLANKSPLLSGKDGHIIEGVFLRVFSAVAQFPPDYPSDRLKSLLFNFFRKEQLKFLYTYAMPIFPLAFTSYLSALTAAQVPQNLAISLREGHGWNLKMWVMVREKNILDRSAADNDLLKWVDIIFKQACILPGTLTDFLKLTFKLVNRYLDKVSKTQFQPASFNRLVEQHEKIGIIVRQKIVQNCKGSETLAQRIQRSLMQSFERAIKQILGKNLQNVALACQNFLQPVKSFVSKIIKKDKQFVLHNTVNKHENLFKPLHAFTKNNAELSPAALAFITDSVEAIVTKYYDSRYAPDIYAYSKDQLISQQVSLVMEVVGRERTTLFKTVQEK